MKSCTPYAVIIACIILFAVHVSAGQGNEPDMKAVAELNRQAVKVLNVDLNSLRWLLGASPDSYLLQESLIEKNQFGAVEALQKNGYAKLEVGTSEMPGGIRGVFLKIVPTKKGQEIIDLLTAAGR